MAPPLPQGPRSISFTFAGSHCPWAAETLSHLANGCQKAGVALACRDVTGIVPPDHQLFPFVPVVDGVATGSPLFAGSWDELAALPPSWAVEPSAPLPSRVPDRIAAEDQSNLADGVSVCLNGATDGGAKAAWRLSQPSWWGWVAYWKGEPVALVEGIESELCPLGGVDRSPGLDILVCLYSNHEEWDFRTALVDTLVSTLAARGTRRIQAIVAEAGHHPNGTRADFEGWGFRVVRDLGPTFLVGLGTDRLWLMERSLAPPW